MIEKFAKLLFAPLTFALAFLVPLMAQILTPWLCRLPLHRILP